MSALLMGGVMENSNELMVVVEKAARRLKKIYSTGKAIYCPGEGSRNLNLNQMKHVVEGELFLYGATLIASMHPEQTDIRLSEICRNYTVLDRLETLKIRTILELRHYENKNLLYRLLKEAEGVDGDEFFQLRVILDDRVFP